MSNNLYKKLEFNHVLENVASFATIAYVKEKIRELTHQTEYEKIVFNLSETDEIMQLFTAYDSYNLSNLHDINSSLKMVREFKILEGLQLKEIALQYQVYLDLKEYISKVDKEKYPIFIDKFNDLIELEDLSKQIDFQISQDGLIYDDASQNLIRINNDIEQYQQKITSFLKQFINDHQDDLMESLITYRNNRAVVPVKLANKNKIKGIIHDESSSRQTVFIEPSQVVEYNNQIQSLEYEKNQEIKIILENLTNEVKKYLNDLESNFNILVDLDILKAKALYSLSISGVIPIINEESAKLEIYQGRHPLIDPSSVVANDFFICNDKSKYRIVLISGSNTGGKTVALKMVGLFALMAQSGLAISAADKTNLPVYKKIFVDIGDGQSIVESLSTFSSHLMNVADIVKNVSEHSLVLLDELGSGTDPREGENLALAIIEYLYQRDASIVVTTHYSKLKNYALSKDYVRSASVLFDKDFARPVYKIVFDSYASSNAFEIASFLGLKRDIIDSAKQLYQSDLSTGDELMLKLADKELETNKLKEELLEKEERLKDKEKRLDILEKDLLINHDRIIEQAKQEANEIIKNTEKESKRVINRLKEKDKFINHEVNEIREDLTSLYQESKVKKKDDKHEYKVDDIVELVKLNRQGRITKILSNNSFEVTIGNLKTKVKKNEVNFVRHQAKEKEKTKVKSQNRINKNISYEINLIGLRVEDALIDLQKYLDSAIVANYNKVRIVHGFGTGALRIAVHDFLKKNKHVKSYSFAEYNEGGQGATIAELK